MSKEQGSESAVSGSQFIEKEEEMTEEKEAPRKVSRRQFVTGAAAVAGAGALASCAPPATPAPGETAAPAPTCPPAGECPPAATPWIPETWDYEADLVIVGFGGAGVAAAIAGADAGASVLVLEKEPLPNGGNAGCSGGNIAVGQTLEGAIEYERSMCWGTVPDDEVIRAYVEGTHELSGWIEQLGGAVIWTFQDAWSPTLPGADGWTGDNCMWRLDVDGEMGTGEQLFKFLRDCATARDISVEAGTVKCATPATELIQDPVTKEILGVKALEGVTFTNYVQHTGGKEIYVKAKKAVILACGGYENNQWMHSQHTPVPHSGFLTWYGTPYNTGDGITMVNRVGARLWHMNKKEAHSFACAPATRELGTGICVMAYGDKLGATSGIIVNRDGKRIYNEYFFSGHTEQHKAYDEFTHRLMPSDDYSYADYRNIPFYWVFDDTRMKAGSLRGTYIQWVGIHKIWEWSEDNSKELEKGWIIKADTIEELGQKIEIKDHFGRVVGMDAAGLAETVTKYNQYCAAGKDLDFGRRADTLIPIGTPPFYAMELYDCLTNTMGGPEHNQHEQTLDADGKPIPRLYSVGEFGSMFGFLYNGQDMAESLSGGRKAAIDAAALEAWA